MAASCGRRLNFGTPRTPLAGATAYSCPSRTPARRPASLPSAACGITLSAALPVKTDLKLASPSAFSATKATLFASANTLVRMHEGEQAVIVGLKIVIDNRMVVALGTLHVHAEHHSADVAGDDVRLAIAVEQEAGGGAGGLVAAIGGQQLAAQLIERLARGKRLPQVLLPIPGIRVFVGPPLDQHHVPSDRHLAGILRAGQQAVDQPGPLVAGRIRQELAGLASSRDIAGQIEINAADEIGIARLRRDRPNSGRINKRIDSFVQRRLVGPHSRGKQQRCQCRPSAHDFGCRHTATSSGGQIAVGGQSASGRLCLLAGCAPSRFSDP